ncbi:TIGR04104 family putative zinc finger protein [Lentibacillus songyuanensis]|uniref:TIGR04104 family putative zinc finger protein n=1 Tax=Lentibacillus songyuanensis TaxID=3136161 RepID=UPI00386215D0
MVLLQQCEICNKQFSWRNVFRSLMHGYMPIYCKACGTKHPPTIGSRIRVALSTLLIVLFGKFIPISISYPLTISIIIIFAILVILSDPFVTRYHADYGSIVKHQ